MNNKVLLVDDEVNILNSYRRNLRNQFEFDVALSGEEALKQLESGKKYAVIISDMQMPKMNGVELLREFKTRSPNTVRLMLTGNADQQTAIDAVNIGDIFRFLNKPCTVQDLANAIKAGLEQHNLIIAEKVLLNKTLKGIINVLNEVLTLVNPDAFGHNAHLKKYMMALAETMELPYSWTFEPMIQLSQLGCVIFPQDTIKHLDSGQSISEEEQQIFNQHPLLASDLIRKIPRMESIAQTILYQEKCYNGEGIPLDEIKGKDIPVGARMLKIVLDFIRAKGTGISEKAAYSKLEQQAYNYDPDILHLFKKSIDIDDIEDEIETEIQTVKIAELRTGMIINEDIKTKQGQLVAGHGQEVTEALMRIIRHCLENGALNGFETVQLENTPKEDIQEEQV